MNKTDQNYTDDFFKQGLSSPPELSPTDNNWEEMERLLTPKAKKRSIAWIYTVSGIAAAILIFISLWLASEKTGSETQQAQEVKGRKKELGSGNKTNSNLNAVNPGSIQNPSVDSLHDNGNNLMTEPFKGNTLPVNSNEGIRQGDATPGSGDLWVAEGRSRLSPVNTARYLTIQTSLTNKFATQREIGKRKTPSNFANAVVADNEVPEPRTPARTGKWALSMALSPDVNSVNNMDYGTLGVSMGMGVSYKLGKALSVGTGIYYSQKLYSADKTSYKVTEKPFATWTSYSKKIEADCRVIDIPVNLSLRISNKTSNKLYASAGMSSYIMLSEKYDFIYNNPSPAFPTGRRVYTVRNENKHILNIVNLAVALETPLSDQVSLVIQPYAKLPLTGIGKGQTDLKSVGVGFALNYGIKKKK